MATVVLVAYADRLDALAAMDATSKALSQSGHTVASLVLGDEPVSLPPESLVVSLGGDGTFLRAAHMAHEVDGQVLGVNLGRVGFLLTVEASAVVEAIEAALAGNVPVERRTVLRVTSPLGSLVAINEVVLERSSSGHMVRVATAIDGDEFLNYSADGVMVATPTGSTAYNFSAGGPVLSPALASLVLTPIAPHFTIDRSIVVDGAARISLTTMERSAQLVADGALKGRLEAGDSVTVTSDERPLRVVVPFSAGLGSRLRQSLREGHA